MPRRPIGLRRHRRLRIRHRRVDVFYPRQTHHYLRVETYHITPRELFLGTARLILHELEERFRRIKRPRLRVELDTARRLHIEYLRLRRRIVTKPLAESNHPSLPMIDKGYRHAALVIRPEHRFFRSPLLLPAYASLVKHDRCFSRASLLKWDGYRGPAKIYLVSQVYLGAHSHVAPRTTPPDLLDYEFTLSWIDKMEDTVTEVVGGEEVDSIGLEARLTIAGRHKLKLPAVYAAYTPWIRYIYLGASEVEHYPCSLYYKALPYRP